MDKDKANSSNVLLQKALYLFACTNSCMNPIVYGAFNLKRNRTERNTVKRITITFKTCQNSIKSRIELCGVH